MKVIGQPTSYSEMLERIFFMTLCVGVGCTAALAHSSNTIGQILDSYNTSADLGPIKGLKIAYVLLPAIAALFSRIIRLHDKISDFLGIRLNFDMQALILPLATGVNVSVSKPLRKELERTRDAVMREVFYKYAGFKEPVIDAQLVLTALDTWGWFWSMLEPQVILVPTALFLFVTGNRDVFWIVTGVAVSALISAALLYPKCRRVGAAEVEAILSDAQRREEVRGYFLRIQPPAPRSK